MSKKSSGKGSGKPIPKPPIDTLKKEFSAKQQNELLTTLKQRFEENMSRHENLDWNKIQSKLKDNHQKLLSLYLMEKTG